MYRIQSPVLKARFGPTFRLGLSCLHATVPKMNRRFVSLLALTLFVSFFPFRSPAPFVYRPGEGWSYEPVGGEGKWQMTRAEDQLAVAQAAFDKKAYRLALKAARRVVRVWPQSDFVPQAQYLVGRCLEAQGD